MSGPSYSQFSAGDSLLGYIYQCEYALYHLLDRDKAPDQISIETLDDIVQGPVEDPQALLQLKLHSGSVKNLTDRHIDLWKTINIWSHYVRDGIVDPSKVSFFLLTSAPLGKATGIGHHLSPQGSPHMRDIPAALKALQETATKILSTPNLDPKGGLVTGASSFSALTDSEKMNLVRNIYIVSGTPSVTNLRKLIDKRLRGCGAAKENHADFVEAIVGWWYGCAINQIADKTGRTISFDALETRISELAKQFAVGALKPYNNLMSPDENDLNALKDRWFAQQLIQVGITHDNFQFKAAVTDYYKADGHIKRWKEEFRIDPKTIDSFNSDIISIWSTHFGSAQAEVDDCKNQQDPCAAYRKLGREVLKDTLSSPAPKLKGFEGEYLARGAYHVLANVPVIGWHPHWETIHNESKAK